MAQYSLSLSLPGRDQPYQVDSLGTCQGLCSRGECDFYFRREEGRIAGFPGESPEALLLLFAEAYPVGLMTLLPV